MKLYKLQQGQILLITLLVLSVATTIALSLIGRSTTDVNISTQVEESSRAFSAAEAGIEQALRLGSVPSSPVFSGGVRYDVERIDVGGATGPYLVPRVSLRGDTETIWLVDHNADGTLPSPPFTRVYTAGTIDVCLSNTSPIAAYLVSILYYDNSGEYRIARAAFDPDDTRRAASGNNFSDIATVNNCGFGSGSYYRQQLTFANFSPAIQNNVNDTLIMLRLQPLYQDAQFAINVPAGETLPLQGYQYRSCGTTGTDITRCILVHEIFRAPDGVFDHVVYSSGYGGGTGNLIVAP